LIRSSTVVRDAFDRSARSRKVRSDASRRRLMTGSSVAAIYRSFAEKPLVQCKKINESARGGDSVVIL
jgi:hypothetical protein